MKYDIIQVNSNILCSKCKSLIVEGSLTILERNSEYKWYCKKCMSEFIPKAIEERTSVINNLEKEISDLRNL